MKRDPLGLQEPLPWTVTYKSVRYLVLNLSSAGVLIQEVQNENFDLTEESQAYAHHSLCYNCCQLCCSTLMCCMGQAEARKGCVDKS